MPRLSLPGTPPKRPLATPVLMLLLSIAAGVFLPHGTHAQRARPPRSTRSAVSGFEMALSGTNYFTRDRLETLHGTAYRVRGLAALEPLPNARVRARLIDDTQRELDPPVTVSADANGRFALPLTVHTEEIDATLEITVSDPALALDTDAQDAEVDEENEGEEGEEEIAETARPAPSERVFLFQVAVHSARWLEVQMDRALYEPGEPVHVLARLREIRSGHPIANETIAFRINHGTEVSTREMTTGASGAVSFDLALPEGDLATFIGVNADVGDQHGSAYALIGRRSYGHLTARVRTEPAEVAPGAPIDVIVAVATPSGAPVRGAHVTLELNDARLEGISDAHGEARIHAVAPTGQRADAAEIALVALVHHAGHGEVRVPGTMRLAMPLSLQIEATPRTPGGLVPEVADAFFLMVTNGFQDPVPSGTEVEVEGPSIRGGRVTVHTDANGLAEVPTLLPAGVWSPSTEDETQAVTSVLVRIHGPLELTSRIAIPVHREGDVAPNAATPVVEPGATLEVALRRRPRAAHQAVIVTLLSDDSIVERVVAAPSANSVRLHIPADRMGAMTIRARLVKEDETAEGAGLSDVILVRPAQPSFVTVRPERAQYFVGDEARLLVEGGSAPAGVRSFGAIVVRDLSAHAEERPFREFFLNRAFDEALFGTSPDAQRLLRAALVHDAFSDVPETTAALVDALGQPIESNYPEQRLGDYRDPFPFARELERRGIRAAMTEVEEALANALNEDALDTITVGTGTGRRFRDDLLFESEVRTAGEGPVAVSDLTASDPSFRYETVARRVARTRLVHLYAALARYLDPGDQASIADRIAAREPADRWLPRLIARGSIQASDLLDPWGGRFALRRVSHPIFSTSQYASNYELASPGPDGRMGTADDLHDPFARVVPTGTPYALATGEDVLMRELARLSAYERTINELTSAYTRVEAEFDEELIGDAVHAGVSEGALGLGNIGTIGHGSGSGSGYGSGGGGMSGRSSSAPRLHAGETAVSLGFDGLSRVLRERFPPTLYFNPTFELDAQGRASFALRVADAITSYVVETIVWRTDGWVWSAETTFSVEREIVVDAAVPGHARTDDVLAVPVRVSNRGTEARRVRVGILASSALGLEASEIREIEVAPNDAVALTFPIQPTQVAQGDVQVACSGLDGVALDAIRLPLDVSRRSRRTRSTFTSLGAGTVSLDWRVPDDAFDARAVLTGQSIAELPTSQPRIDHVWTDGFTRQPQWLGNAMANIRSEQGRLALRVAGFWPSDELPSREALILRIASPFDAEHAEGRTSSAEFALASEMLLDLVPMIRSDVVEGRSSVVGLIQRLRAMVTNGITEAAGNPDALAAAASALAWTSEGDAPDPVATVLVRRVESARITVGVDTFVATEGDPLRASAHLALAYLRLGRNDDALALLTTIVRWQASLADEDTTRLANTALRLLALTSPALRGLTPAEMQREVSAHLDGTLVAFETATGQTVEVTPGAHHLTLEGESVEVSRVDVTVMYRRAWPAAPVRGPMDLRIEGEVGALDAVTELVLVVRNTTPRVLNNAVVDVELPTGAELSESSANLATQDAETIGLRIPSLRPSAEARIRLPLRWRVAGTLRGLGLIGYVAGSEDRAAIVPPRELTITPREASNGGAR